MEECWFGDDLEGFEKGLQYRLSYPYHIAIIDKDASDEDTVVKVTFNWHRLMEHEEPFKIFWWEI